MMKAVEDGHRDLIKMLEDQRLFVEQVPVEFNSLSPLIC
jgi:hypothetical protein